MPIEIIIAVIVGASVGGFISGFAGFGLALVVSGLWFAVLPASLVPPLVVFSASVGQLVGLAKMSRQISWPKAWPLVWAGLSGVPLGTALISLSAPDQIKLGVGVFLLVYTLWQLLDRRSNFQLPMRSKLGERLVGFAGGILGGVAGLSGPLPIIWYQLQGLSPVEQRARYQPFNLAILTASAASMLLFGHFTPEVFRLAALAAPAIILGAILGLWLFAKVSARGFKRAVMALLFLSGAMILVQTLG